MLTLAATLSGLAWIYLALGHGRYWRADQRIGPEPETGLPAPSVVAVVPARDEADVIGEAIASLVSQDYPGLFHVVLVDDRSSDGTAAAARAAAEAAGRADRLTIVTAPPLEAGWVGKLWAVSAGLREAALCAPDARYALLTDADIRHPRDNVRRLVAKAEREGHDLVSLMVRLHCRSFWEHRLIPAFVYFFQLLYPFPRVNDRRSRVAGAAGGCMLVRREALERAGGIAAIRGAIIDDCELASRLKPNGSIWLGLATDVRSLRPYRGLAGIWHMIARSAFTQLRHSVLLLALMVLAFTIVFFVPPAAVAWGLVSGSAAPFLLGAGAWTIMALIYVPALRLYGRPALESVLLPFIGFLYVLMTIDSARAHWAGRGGAWKGRTYPAAPNARPDHQDR
ncbi:MAG: glycosyltransferase [Alphaproteobacteria bacterium]